MNLVRDKKGKNERVGFGDGSKIFRDELVGNAGKIENKSGNMKDMK